MRPARLYRVVRQFVIEVLTLSLIFLRAPFSPSRLRTSGRRCCTSRFVNMTNREIRATARPTTPPRASGGAAPGGSPLTPEQVRRLEINRLKAKALREEREAASAATAPLKRSDSTAAGKKRSFATYSAQAPPTRSRRKNRGDLHQSSSRDYPACAQLCEICRV